MRKPLHSTTYLAPSDTHFVVGRNAHSYGWSFDQHKIYVSMDAYYHTKLAKNASLIFALCQLRQAQFPIGDFYFFFLKSSFSPVFIRGLCHFAYVFVTTLYRSIVTISYAK
nr:MAG TPA: hypothetical protein [Caudoviricetes sp.]